MILSGSTAAGGSAPRGSADAVARSWVLLWVLGVGVVFSFIVPLPRLVKFQASSISLMQLSLVASAQVMGIHKTLVKIKKWEENFEKR